MQAIEHALTFLGLLTCFTLVVFAILCSWMRDPNLRRRGRAIPRGSAGDRVSDQEAKAAHLEALAYDREHREELRGRLA